MTRYIDADELLRRLPDDLPYKGSVKRVLMQSPTADVVGLVRCKDCKHCEQSYLCKLKGEEAELAYTCRVIDKRVSPNHYCSCGKRRTN